MRLWVSLLLPGLIGAVQAASDTAKVYLLEKPQQQRPSTRPTLTPEQARLIFAQRLGVSQYHSLRHANDGTLTHINTFGLQERPLFAIDVQHDVQAHLVVVIESNPADSAQGIRKLLNSAQPVFEMANPPSSATTAQLVKDLAGQISPFQAYPECPLEQMVDPYRENCWLENRKMLHIDLSTV
jgi:hypothetical protein